jgi:hypothetical protein
MLEKLCGRCGLDLSDSEYDTVAGSCEHDNKTSGSIKGREFIEQRNDYQLLKKDDFALWR